MMLLRKWFGRVAAGFAAIGLMGTAQARPAPRTHAATPALAHPGLWKLQDRDTIIYLFGTIHALPANVRWRTPAFEKAFGGADELLLEIGNIDDQQAVAGELMKAGLGTGLPPVLDRVPADKREALRTAIADSGVPTAAFDRMKSWMAALMLVNVTFKRIGLDPEQGVERQLVREWKAKQRNVTGFESAAEQFGFLDHLSADAQQKFLIAAAEKPGETRKQFAAMLRAWEAGDVKAIAATFDDETQMSNELRDVLMKGRNAHWAAALAERMKKPGKVFVAVGAGHLAGPDSVQAMLARRGLRAVRVQ
jgi:uncharacterized protein YbaP (TraB family)